MSEPEKPVPHAFLAPGDDRYTLIDGGAPLTKEQAIEALRRSPPKELGNTTEVELLAYSDDGTPVRLGKHRVRYDMGDMLRSMMGGSFTVRLGGTK